MAKEFDIYLRDHLTKCDLLVYSIPFREGITVTDRLILETALNGYLLQKFAASQMGSELAAHIDEMIKFCYEKLSMGAALDAAADFEAKAMLRINHDPIVIDAPDVELLGQAFNEVEVGLVMAVEPLVTQVSSSTGRGNFPMLVGAGVSDVLKRGLLDLKGAVLSKAAVDQINQVDYIGGIAPAAVNSSLRSLCFNMSFDAAAAVEIVTLVLGTEIYHSLGIWYDGLALNSRVTGTWAQKFIAAESVASIMQQAVGKLVKIVYPDSCGTVIGAPALNIGMKRRRMLNEMDNLCLKDMDNMSLAELDYVWIT